MTEPHEEGLSASGVRIARVWTILLVALLAVNFGLVALAVGKRGGPVPAAQSVPSTAEVATSSFEPAAAEQADAPQPPVNPTSEAMVEVAVEAPVTQWEDAEREAHVIPEPAELELPVVAQAAAADTGKIAVTEVAPLPETPVDPMPPAPRDIPTASVPPTPVAIPSNALILVNPPDSGGVVHYAVDEVVFSLPPGEYQQLDDLRERRIRFHRGDDSGEADHRLQRGIHLFVVGEMGWELRPADDNLARRLLTTCRPLTAEK